MLNIRQLILGFITERYFEFYINIHVVSKTVFTHRPPSCWTLPCQGILSDPKAIVEIGNVPSFNYKEVIEWGSLAILMPLQHDS